MDVFAEIRAEVLATLEQMAADGELPAGLDSGPVTVLPPRDGAHGEMATNAALVLAKPAGRKPREIAELLAARLQKTSGVQQAEVAGAGFVNLRLPPDRWQEATRAALCAGTDYGRPASGGGMRVNVEFVSANPTGPLHIGHARGAVYGDALASLLEYCGDEVTREYYVNDGGAQVEVLARSAHLRYREALGEKMESPPEGYYPGAYLVPVGEALAKKFGDVWRDAAEADWLEPVREFAVAAMMEEIRADLASLGVEMDNYVSERALEASGRIEQTVGELEARGLVYEGVLERPKGVKAEEWEPRRQTLFRATEYGDDSDRPLRKADGSWAYFAPDLAYHADKLSRGFQLLLDVWGEDHGGYVRRMAAAVTALAGESAGFDVRLCRMVRLSRGGQPMVMSKRAGNFVTLREVLDEVGRDVLRFALLTRKNDAPLDFDLEQVLEQSRDNPVFYVHYAHARACSALRHAAEELEGVDLTDAGLAGAELSQLSQESALALMRRIAAWPAMVAAAARAHEPHRVSFYLQDLAAELHALWSAGRSDDSLRLVRKADPEGSRARLALVRAAAIVIASGFGILGVAPREEMC